MNDETRPSEQREDDAARLTAYALGELDEKDRADVEAGLQSTPGSDVHFHELQRIVESLQSEAERCICPEPSDQVLAAVLDKLEQVESVRPMAATDSLNLAGRQPRRRTWISLALCACLVIAAIPFGYRALSPRVDHEVVDSLSRAVAARTWHESREGRSEREQMARVEGETAVRRTNAQESKQTKNATAAEIKELADQAEAVRVHNQALEEEHARLVEQVSRMKAVVEKMRQPQTATAPLAGSGAATRSGVAMQQQQNQFPATAVSPQTGAGGMAGMGMSTGMGAPLGAGYGEGGYGGAMPSGMEGYGGGGIPAHQAGGAYGMSPVELQVSGGTIAPGYPGMPGYDNLALMGVAGLGDSLEEMPKAPQIPYGAPAGFQRHFLEQGTEHYAPIVENNFLPVAKNPLSTFSIDVDTASYANVRRFLTQDQLPPPDAVRIEELINYFTYDYAPPKEDDPFAVHIEVAECPWQPEHDLLRIGIQGQKVPVDERPACNLVFLLDVSGSMKDADKLPLLKQAMKLLVGQLTESDRVAIVTYASEACINLDSTTGDKHDAIRAAIDALNADGSTHGSAGIQLAYQVAARNAIENGNNRVILASDGDLNVGVTEDDALVQLIKEQAAGGVFLTVLGFGQGNLKDSKLEKLADNGNGSYAYIDNLREARKVLVEQVSGSLLTIAKDVKIKVEFNPAEVHSYRLIGYENRLMTAAEFDDDKKDAGEIGAGHTVTALYELVPAKIAVVAAGESLKYQHSPEPPIPAGLLTDAAKSGELLTLFLRFKSPDSDESSLREFAIENQERRFGEASGDFQFAAAVASFGMLLRNSQHRGTATFAAVEEIAASVVGNDAGGYRTEFLDLVRRAAVLARPE